jgi:hypothetical protein
MVGDKINPREVKLKTTKRRRRGNRQTAFIVSILNYFYNYIYEFEKNVPK